MPRSKHRRKPGGKAIKRPGLARNLRWLAADEFVNETVAAELAALPPDVIEELEFLSGVNEDELGYELDDDRTWPPNVRYAELSQRWDITDWTADHLMKVGDARWSSSERPVLLERLQDLLARWPIAKA